jgi:putative tricarboxylic transport membrane protein
MMMRRYPGEAIIGAGLAVLGAVMLWALSSLEIAAAYAKIGPAVIPGMVAGGLLLVGTALSWSRRNSVDRATPSDLVALAALAAGVIGYALVLRTIGFVVASALLFFLVAWGFGIRRHVVNAVTAILLGIAVFVLFQYGLGLNLPRGPLEAMLP